MLLPGVEDRPRLFARVVTVAVEALEFLIASVLLKKSREVSPEQTEVHRQRRQNAEQTDAVLLENTHGRQS